MSRHEMMTGHEPTRCEVSRSEPDRDEPRVDGGRESSPGQSRYDCVVIGGGHNGLVCAAYLARGGRSVLVLEAADEVGGAAVTREFAPGFHVSACAHLLYAMSPAIIKDLNLEEHGLSFVANEMPTVALSADGNPLVLGPHGMLSSADDAVAYINYVALLDRLSQALRPIFDNAPPRLGTDAWADRRALLQLGWQIRRLGRHDMRELLRIAGMNVYDLLQEQFTSPLLQGALAFDAILGTNYGPRSPGSVFTLLYRLASTNHARTAVHRSAAHGPGGVLTLAQPQGGLGALSRALAAAATASGVDIRTRAAVQRIVVQNHRAVGVQLASGEVISADTVVSNADPLATFLHLLGAEHLDAEFTRRVSHLRTRGLAAKLHLALDELPQFKGVPTDALGGRLLIAPSLDYLERAFNHSKYGEYSAAPAMEITLPTIADPTLAPAGKHVLSAIVQYAPYSLKSGRKDGHENGNGWDQGRREFTETVVDTLEQYAPGLQIVATQLLTPHDIEREFRITGGHWHHTELALDQFFMLRPLPGAAQYQTPVDGLYLCGAGCHPGGGVMGAAGRNAARKVLGEAA